jgi:hypothetical protein
MMHRPQRFRSPGGGRSHGRLTGVATALLVVATLSPAPADASLLRPVLQLIRPQLEQRLSSLCLAYAAGGEKQLEGTLREPCRKLAGPASTCLVEEAERSGRSFGVLTEMLSGRFGEDSELVVKRCIARMLSLPPDTLRDVPLQDLNRRFGQRSRTPVDPRLPDPG